MGMVGVILKMTTEMFMSIIPWYVLELYLFSTRFFFFPLTLVLRKENNKTLFKITNIKLKEMFSVEDHNAFV